MTKILSLDDLIRRKEFENSSISLKNLYDLIIPLGIPQSIIIDLIELFDLTIEKRTLQFENSDMGPINVIVLRGDLEIVRKAELFMKNELRKWTENLKNN